MPASFPSSWFLTSALPCACHLFCCCTLLSPAAPGVRCLDTCCSDGAGRLPGGCNHPAVLRNPGCTSIYSQHINNTCQTRPDKLSCRTSCRPCNCPCQVMGCCQCSTCGGGYRCCIGGGCARCLSLSAWHAPAEGAVASISRI